jgi:hypothetical protein
MRVNRYHDADGDGVGILIEGNEITNVRENGNHSDCLQAVWVGDHMIYRRNYVHDNRCQGFFIKDQASSVNTVVAEDNLMLRNDMACDGASGCGQPSIFQLFGPMTDLTVRRNTIWTPGGGSPTTLRDNGWSGSRIFDSNVISRPWSDTSAPFGSGYTSTNNVSQGGTEGSWPSTGFTTVSSPAFANAAADDYRTNDGRGVTWAPANQVYGPGDSGNPPPPPDTTAPETTITSGPADPSTSTSASLAFTSNETGSTFACKLDGGAYAACTSPKAYSGLSTGSHTFSVRATDAAGNTDATAATWTWTVNAPADTTPPNTTISSGPSNPTTSTSASFAFSSSESGSTFECKLDSAAYAACTSPKSYSGLSTGSHTFSVRATDAAGNTDASPATQTWTINAPSDTTAPDTTIGSGPNGLTNDATPSFAFTSTEAGSTFACRVDSGAWNACTSPWTTPALGDGDHTVSVRATDAAGNTDATPATRSFTVDTTAPTTTITSAPPALSLSNSGSVTFTVNDSGATSQCRLDGGAWTACTSPYQVSGLGIGSHTVDVRSTDRVGNVESPGASVSWTVVLPVAPLAGEAAGPTVTLTAPTANSSVTKTARFAATATSGSPVKRVEFWIDGKRVATDTSAPYKAKVDVSRVHPGTHTMSARAFDAAGKAASTGALVKVGRTATGRVRAVDAGARARAAMLATAVAGPDSTRLAGHAPKGRKLKATLARCDDPTATIVDRPAMRADGRGALGAMREAAGLCVVGLFVRR